MKMQRRVAVPAFALAAATLGAFAVPRLQDENKQNLDVTGWKSWKVERLEGGKKLRLFVRAEPGGVVVAKWIKEGVTFQAAELEMVATADYKLISARLDKAIEFEANRPSAAGKGRQILNVTAPAASYDAVAQIVKVPGKITLVRSDSATGERMDASGASGKITLSEKGKDIGMIQEAALEGPVRFTMKGTRIEPGDEKTPDKKLPFSITGGGNRLTFSDVNKQIVFSGEVSLKGDDPFLAGEISGVDKATIQLNDKREIESVEMEGNPGRTKVEQKGGGGKKRRRE